MKILVIEDDKDTVEILRLTLEVYDPDAVIIPTEKGFDGLETARSTQLDLVLLDLGLPDIDGMEVLKELRKFSKTPILVVSARHDPEVITNALTLGAEDYILKPFSLHTFLTYLKGFSTPDSSVPFSEDQSRITQDLIISRKNRRATLKGHEIVLTQAEWTVLDSLLAHYGRIVTIRDLVQLISQNSDLDESSVHQIVNQLRKKLGDNPDLPNLIVSEYNCGYRFMKTVSAS
jgi:DNA-binding response OmpR family regulator